tara:strand:+ start:4066 stop:4986 length:921 start_codon:yes stop_codon:yes gene_type:complete
VDSDFKKLEEKLTGKSLWNEPMKRHTSYGIGGPALGLFYPADEKDLSDILVLSQEKSIPVFFTGSGSNLLVSDDGFDGFIISLAKTFKTLEIDGENLYAECGVMMGHFVKKCAGAQLKGVESLIGVPGTLGGAIKMNAGAYGREISNFLTDLKVMNLSGNVKRLRRDEIEFDYRHSSLQDDEIVISARFKFNKGTAEEIHNLKSKASQSRKMTQPLRFRSAGSVFKNPPEIAAGQLIDQAGLKGTRVGDAEISEKHANFFVNHGDASSEDVAELIRLTRRTVKEQFNIKLELEIKTLGFSKGAFNA